MRSLSNKLSLGMIFVLLSTSLSLLTGCSSNNQSHHSYEMAPLNALSEDLQAAPEEVREAYQFAIANQELLKNFPCYCGCGGVGHENNLDCYIQEVTPDGTIIFENHAFG